MFLAAPDESIWIGVLRLGIYVPESRSLKDKRRVVAQIRDRLRARQGFSVAEVGHLDDRSRAVLAVVTVSNDARLLRSTLDQVVHDVVQWNRGVVEQRDIEILRPFAADPPGGSDLDDASEHWR